MIFNYLCAANSAAGANAEGSTQSPVTMIIFMVAIFAVMYLLMIRPQKKKQQEEQKLRDSVQIGDEITTIGGIQGRIVTVKDDSIILETGPDRTKMKFMRWAIQTNDTANARAAEEKAAADAQKAEEKAEKKAGKRRSKKDSEE